MSFALFHSNSDSFRLSSDRYFGPKDIQYSPRYHNFSVRVIEAARYFETEEGVKFKEVLFNTYHSCKDNQLGTFYTFSDPVEFHIFCKNLSEHELLNQETLEHIEGFIKGMRKTLQASNRTFELAKKEKQAPPAETKFCEVAFPFLDEMDVKSALTLCLESNRLSNYYDWLDAVENEKSIKKCLGTLFLGLKRLKKKLPESAFNLIWGQYRLSLVKIEQKSHIRLLLYFLAVSPDCKRLQMLSVVIFSIGDFKLTKLEHEFVLQQLNQIPNVNDVRNQLLLKLQSSFSRPCLHKLS